VATFRADYAWRGREELDTFRSEPSLEAAVKRAAVAETPDGKRYSHQTRLTRTALKRVRQALVNAPLAECQDFAALHLEIQQRISHIRGIGELMVYDTAHRIGAKLSLSPDVVYLHRGTREGARALGVRGSAKQINVSALPVELQGLCAGEIEDFLCVFKSDLRELRFRD
jgi:hypothetical protein